MTREIFEDFISEISDQYTYDTYDILRNNCNNFTQVACNFLTGNSIPGWIANLPEEVLSTPFGRMIEPMISQWTTRMKQQSMLSQGMDPSNFPATQAAFAQQFFPGQNLGPAAPSTATPAVAPPSSAPALTPAAPASTPSGAALHTRRRPLFSDQKPSSFDATLKQLQLGDRAEETVSALRAFLEHSQPLSQAALDVLLDYANTCPVSSGFAPLFLLRLMVLNSAVNKSFSSDPRALTIIERFITDDAPVPSKAMAMLLCSNLFADKAGEALILNAPFTATLLGTELMASVDQRRTPASGLLYNYSLALSSLPKDTLESQYGDRLWQGVTLTAEVISEAVRTLGSPSKLTTSEDEFLWRALASLLFYIQADSAAAELATQLELVPAIVSINEHSPSTKLSQLTLDLQKHL